MPCKPYSALPTACALRVPLKLSILGNIARNSDRTSASSLRIPFKLYKVVPTPCASSDSLQLFTITCNAVNITFDSAYLYLLLLNPYRIIDKFLQLISSFRAVLVAILDIVSIISL